MVGEKKFLSWLTVNRACNLHCRWCYSRAMASSASMELDLAKKIIAFMSELPIKYVILIGGEPTVYSHFFEVLQEIKKQGMKSAIITNSIRFANPDFLEETVKAGVYAITTSLKAGTEEDYGRLTGKRRLRQTILGIQNITRKKIKHKVSVTLGASLINSFDKVMEALKEAQPEAFTISFERPVIIGNKMFFDDDSNVDKMSKFIQEVYPKLEELGIRFTLTLSMPLCWYSDDFLALLEKRGELNNGCQMLSKEGVVIDPSGYLIPCNHFCSNPLAKFGVDFTTGEDYLRLRKRTDVLQFYETMGKSPHIRCTKCDKWSKCGAGCRLYWLYQGPEKTLPS